MKNKGSGAVNRVRPRTSKTKSRRQDERGSRFLTGAVALMEGTGSFMRVFFLLGGFLRWHGLEGEERPRLKRSAPIQIGNYCSLSLYGKREAKFQRNLQIPSGTHSRAVTRWAVTADCTLRVADRLRRFTDFRRLIACQLSATNWSLTFWICVACALIATVRA